MKSLKKQKHTTVGIRWWSPTQLLVYRSEANLWQIVRNATLGLVGERRCHNNIEALNILMPRLSPLEIPQHCDGLGQPQ